MGGSPRLRQLERRRPRRPTPSRSPTRGSSRGCRATAAARGWATAATSTATSSTASPAARAFEEHASFCDICVQITLKTKQLTPRADRCTRSDKRSTRHSAGPALRAPLPPSRRSDGTRDDGHPQSTAVEAATAEAALLARLGLPRGASSQDVEVGARRARRVPRRRAGRPARLGRAADRVIDEAFALLSDPTIDRSGPTAARHARPPAGGRPRAPEPRGDDDEHARTQRSCPAKAAPARAGRRVRTPPSAPSSPVEPLIRRIGRSAPCRRRRRHRHSPASTSTAAPASRPINGTPAPEAAAQRPASTRRRSPTLMQKISSRPEGHRLAPVARRHLLPGAATTRAPADVPGEDHRGRPEEPDRPLALGAALFNLGDDRGAEEQWRAVLAVEPNNLEAHYDLGFMYLSRTRRTSPTSGPSGARS